MRRIGLAFLGFLGGVVVGSIGITIVFGVLLPPVLGEAFYPLLVFLKSILFLVFVFLSTVWAWLGFPRSWGQVGID